MNFEQTYALYQELHAIVAERTAGMTRTQQKRVQEAMSNFFAGAACDTIEELNAICGEN